jgi:hypothetical protein
MAVTKRRFRYVMAVTKRRFHPVDNAGAASSFEPVATVAGIPGGKKR